MAMEPCAQSLLELVNSLHLRLVRPSAVGIQEAIWLLFGLIPHVWPSMTSKAKPAPFPAAADRTKYV